MASGFLALLDDIAVLARAAAASLDDLATQALKASAKSAGVVIDDAAVTPQYVQGISPKRELGVIKRITIGSLRNKFLFILPAALLFTAIAPWVLPIMLIAGGSYLAYEGAEKVLGWLGWHLHPEKHEVSKETEPGAFENKLVSGAVRTDLILSAEIMLITLSNIATDSFWERLIILVMVALLMTGLVYGVVAILVKMDDLGILLAKSRRGLVARLGEGLVKLMPKVFAFLTIVGTIAMLWVGGHIIIASLSDLGVTFLYDALHHVTDLVKGAGAVVVWLTDTALSAVFGVIWGLVIVGGVVVVAKIRLRKQVVRPA